MKLKLAQTLVAASALVSVAQAVRGRVTIPDGYKLVASDEHEYSSCDAHLFQSESDDKSYKIHASSDNLLLTTSVTFSINSESDEKQKNQLKAMVFAALRSIEAKTINLNVLENKTIMLGRKLAKLMDSNETPPAGDPHTQAPEGYQFVFEEKLKRAEEDTFEETVEETLDKTKNDPKCKATLYKAIHAYGEGWYQVQASCPDPAGPKVRVHFLVGPKVPRQQEIKAVVLETLKMVTMRKVELSAEEEADILLGDKLPGVLEPSVPHQSLPPGQRRLHPSTENWPVSKDEGIPSNYMRYGTVDSSPYCKGFLLKGRPEYYPHQNKYILDTTCGEIPPGLDLYVEIHLAVEQRIRVSEKLQSNQKYSWWLGETETMLQTTAIQYKTRPEPAVAHGQSWWPAEPIQQQKPAEDVLNPAGQIPKPIPGQVSEQNTGKVSEPNAGKIYEPNAGKVSEPIPGKIYEPNPVKMQAPNTVETTAPTGTH